MPFMGIAPTEACSNMGKPWKQEELGQLLNEIKEKKSFQDIALLHKRTVGGVTSRLREIAARLHLDEDKSVQECIEITGLDKETVVDAISRREFKESVKAKNKTNKLIVSEITAPKVTEKPGEIAELRNEIVSIKSDIKEILRLMNLLYDFETQ